mmetsp:Transcript_24740/g.52722  ORF Transcript_24740/g.52722 Transcript_24740/m.52722 type:complete len:274 (-) Transcript_24740:56-877(-)
MDGGADHPKDLPDARSAQAISVSDGVQATERRQPQRNRQNPKQNRWHAERDEARHRSPETGVRIEKAGTAGIGPETKTKGGGRETQEAAGLGKQDDRLPDRGQRQVETDTPGLETRNERVGSRIKSTVGRVRENCFRFPVAATVGSREEKIDQGERGFAPKVYRRVPSEPRGRSRAAKQALRHGKQGQGILQAPARKNPPNDRKTEDEGPGPGGSGPERNGIVPEGPAGRAAGKSGPRGFRKQIGLPLEFMLLLLFMSLHPRAFFLLAHSLQF